MLRTNSKKAQDNLWEYIKSSCGDYLEERAEFDDLEFNAESKKDVASLIWELYRYEKPYTDKVMYACRMKQQDIFEQWGQGLACGGLFDYYYNVIATDLVAKILEETEEEKSRYKEFEAEEFMTRLIYNWVIKHKE